MDAFSEILSGVKLNGALFFNAEFSSPWAVVSPGAAALAPVLAPGAQHMVIYHLVVEGRLSVSLPDGASITVNAGEIVVLPKGDLHSLASTEGLAESPEHALEAIKKIKARDLSLLRIPGDGETTHVVCGFMVCDPHIGRPILSGLPPVFKVNVRGDASGRWLEGAIVHLVDETGCGIVGSEAMLAKLSEALFVDTLRRYVAGLPEQQTGWLAGARDPVVGRSLGLLHKRVRDPWTVAALAKEVGLSRSALVERFTKYLAEPPIAYLTRWRLQLAAQSLARTPKAVAEIASDVGYESEAAFNRAFKRHFGLPPARYRREQRTVSSPLPPQPAPPARAAAPH